MSEGGNVYQEETFYFDEDYCFLLYLDKDLLFKKYNGLGDIYDEVVSHLRKNGFVVSTDIHDNFLIDYVGQVSATVLG